MMSLKLDNVVPMVLALLGGLALGLWFLSSPGKTLQERVPGTDRPAATATNGPAGLLQSTLIKSNGAPAALSGAWPRFRGPNLDGISPDPTPLARAWPDHGPRVLWKIEVGEGFAGAALWHGRVYLLDYDRPGTNDALRCLSLDDGRELWRHTYPAKIKRNHGMSRTVPAPVPRSSSPAFTE